VLAGGRAEVLTTQFKTFKIEVLAILAKSVSGYVNAFGHPNVLNLNKLVAIDNGGTIQEY
jgi:hypothetical protein